VAPPGREYRCPEDPPTYGAVAFPACRRSSTSQEPSARSVEKWTVSAPPATGTAAGTVADVLTTRTSPGRSNAGRSVNR
jgi:hypothetical protein